MNPARLRELLRARWNELHTRDQALEEADAIRLVDSESHETTWDLDVFGEFFFLTVFESPSEKMLAQLGEELRGFGVRSGVSVLRERGKPPVVLEIPGVSGPAQDRVGTEEGLRFHVLTHESFHSGWFLDQKPLRRFLREFVRTGDRVLNAFCYTGALSLAAHQRSQARVSNLDLSRPTLEVLRKNVRLNDWDPERFPLIREDFFVFAKRARNWDPAKKFSGIILDPPSFSRGKSGTFSTERDWSKLHALAGTLFDRSAERLWISSSLNTRALSPKQVLVEMKEGLKQADLTVVEIVFEIHPEKREFPASKHLKGFVALLKPGSA